MFRAALHHARARGLSAPRQIPASLISFRLLSITTARSASLFGEVTQGKPAEVPETETNVEAETEDVKPQNDTKLQEYYMEEAKKEQISREKFVSDIKRRLFDLNVAANGFFKNNQIVKDPQTKKSYKLTLTPEEIDILEPSVYIHSYRIKSSMKKATHVNRFARGMNVKTAINQLHFNPKKMAGELAKFLKTGLEQGRELGYDEDQLYVQALWTGSDGSWVKRPDIKGRGRTGIIEHPYIHLKAILRTEKTKRRLAWEKEQAQAKAKPKVYLNTEPLNFKVRGLYKW